MYITASSLIWSPICWETWVGTDLGEKSIASTPLQVAAWECSLSSTAISACLQKYTGNRKSNQKHKRGWTVEATWHVIFFYIESFLKSSYKLVTWKICTFNPGTMTYRKIKLLS